MRRPLPGSVGGSIVPAIAHGAPRAVRGGVGLGLASAASTAPALAATSADSRAGTESATMPAPAWT